MKILARILLIVPLFAGVACSRNNVTIKGLVDCGEGSTLALEKLDVNRTVTMDSVRIDQSGRFSISIRLDEAELFILKYGSGEILNLLLAPGDRVRVTTSAESFGSGYRIEGSVESENIRMLVEKLNSTRSLLDSLNTVAESIEDPGSPHMDLVRSAYVQAIVSQKRFSIRYLVGHMTSLSSVYALYQKYENGALVLGQETDFPYFRAVADSLEITHPNSSLTRSLLADIAQRETSLKEMNQMNTLLEMAHEATGMLDLSIADREGHEIPLSAYKGKVTLVIFWASGNQESVNALLQLRPVYRKYHPKGFEIYAISLDNNKLQWMNSVDFNEFEWINVSELNYPNSRANQLYNVTALPTGYLINREGDVVAKNLYGRNLETWLDNLI
ncbi:MAG: TlpA disulfide reductase family protein [Bacteroidota bacterium]